VLTEVWRSACGHCSATAAPISRSTKANTSSTVGGMGLLGEVLTAVVLAYASNGDEE
jgi:hypothetical protein